MAYDKFQGLFAFGTSSGMIHIVSLKGFEHTIFDAHKSEIRYLQFLPNKGILLAIDEENSISQWFLKNIDSEPKRQKIIDGKNISTVFYCPPFLSSEMQNHNQVFVGMSSGNVFIYQIQENSFSKLVIWFDVLFPSGRKKSTVVSDIKTNPEQMHRLLIAYEELAVVVYSVNKNRDIQRINFGDFDNDLGKALSVEWLPPDSTRFVVGFSTGILAFYKTGSSNQRPYSRLNLPYNTVYEMWLKINERSRGTNVLIASYTAEKNHNQIGQSQKSLALSSGLDNSDEKEVQLLYGKNYESQLNVSEVMPEQMSWQDKFFLTCGDFFALQDKNSMLENHQFKENQKEGEEEEKRSRRKESEEPQFRQGQKILEMLDQKKASDFYEANLLFILTTSLKIMYINLDALSIMAKGEEKSLKMRFFNGIIGQSDQIMRMSLSQVSKKDQQYLSCMEEYKQSFWKKQLQRVYNEDQVLQQQLDPKSKHKKPLLMQLVSDIEIELSLNYEKTAMTNLPVQAFLLTADSSGVLRVYALTIESTQLVFKMQMDLANMNRGSKELSKSKSKNGSRRDLEESDASDESEVEEVEDLINNQVSSLSLYLKAKTIFVTTTKGLNYLVSPQLKQMYLRDLSFKVTKVLFMDYKFNDFWALALDTGNVIIKGAHAIVNSEVAMRVNTTITEEDKFGKITAMQFFPNSDLIVFGSAEGYIASKNILKITMGPEKRHSMLQKLNLEQVKDKQTLIIKLEEHERKKAILQIEELPAEVSQARNQCYYVLSVNNLYCLARSDNEVLQAFFPDDKEDYPMLVQMGFVMVKQWFALALLAMQDNLLFCDPFTLQPFTSLVLPLYPSFSFNRHFFTSSNVLHAFGRHNFLTLELDSEAKDDKEMMFHEKLPPIFDQKVRSLLQPDLEFVKPTGLRKIFKKYITVQQALNQNRNGDKYSGREDRKEEEEKKTKRPEPEKKQAERKKPQQEEEEYDEEEEEEEVEDEEEAEEDGEEEEEKEDSPGKVFEYPPQERKREKSGVRSMFDDNFDFDSSDFQLTATKKNGGEARKFSNGASLDFT